MRGLRRLDQHADAGRRRDAASLAQLGNAREHRIGALRSLDREYGISGDDCRLPEIEWSSRFEQPERTCDVGVVSLRGPDAPDRPRRHQDLRRDFMRGHNAKSVILESARDI